MFDNWLGKKLLIFYNKLILNQRWGFCPSNDDCSDERTMF